MKEILEKIKTHLKKEIRDGTCLKDDLALIDRLTEIEAYPCVNHQFRWVDKTAKTGYGYQCLICDYYVAGVGA